MYTDTSNYVQLSAKQESMPNGWSLDGFTDKFYIKEAKPFELYIVRCIVRETEVFVWVLEPNVNKTKHHINFVSENLNECVAKAESWINGDTEYNKFLAARFKAQREERFKAQREEKVLFMKKQRKKSIKEHRVQTTYLDIDTA